MKKLSMLMMLIIASVCSSMYGQNYAEVLQKSMFFYEAQRAGVMPENNRITWRGDAAFLDGQDVGVDLNGGWFDAGDHVKFNFPMAYSVTTLCWGYIENKEVYESTGQKQYFLENIKWVTDYLIKCHTAPNELYAQVGDGDEDHSYWVPAEVIHIRSQRASYKIDAANPGSDLAAETAAALASASIVFADEDPAYSQELLSHAEQLYSFADNYRGVYSDVIPVGAFYKSWSGYQDELVWGAIWLHKATGNSSYLSKARSEYEFLGNEEREEVKSYGWTIAWDDKSYGCYVLMAELTGEASYCADAERFLDQWFTSSTDSKGPTFTGAGFPILSSWGSFRYAANTAFLMLEYSDVMSDVTKQQQYRSRAKEITDYLLGDNPQNMSYVIGYGSNFPQNPHHRTAHGSWARDEKAPVETRHILYGALVGGHKLADDYNWVDSRHDYYWNEVACDYNSLFTGVVARLAGDIGGTIDPSFPPIEIPTGEFLVESKLNSSGSTHSEYAVWAHNRTAWPARIPNLSFRIFVDISEGIAAGYSSSDYIVSANGSNATISELTAWDATNHIYYVEVRFNDDVLIYPGGQGETKEESQIRVRLPYDAPASAWDPTNDWSYQDISGDLGEVSNIPLYANRELVYGNEPNGGVVIPVEDVEVSPTSLQMCLNETSALNVSVLPVNATNKNVTYSSSNTAVATVSSTGIVTAVSAGIADITVTTVDGGFTDVVSVSTTACVIPVTGVNLSPAEVSMKIGESSSLTAVVVPSNATDKFVVWTSSNEAVASVNQSGVITAVALGEAIISVTTNDGGFVKSSAISVVTTPVYQVATDIVGLGNVVINPEGGEYEEGTIITIEAIADDGHHFTEWTGDVNSNENPLTITVNSNMLVVANFEEDGTTPCDSPTPINLSYSFDGAGEYCWVTSEDISYINSWCLNSLVINGVDYTNVWSNSFPEKINGNYYISYSGDFGWSHFEAVGLNKNAQLKSEIKVLNEVRAYPNPLQSDELVIVGGEDIIDASITVHEISGKQIMKFENVKSQKITISKDKFKAGIYLINVNKGSAQQSLKVIVK